MERRRIVSEAQWVDWYHMEEQQDPIYNQVIAACENHHIKKLMSVYYDWNIEVIAQLYATLFIEEAEDVRAMHWMMEGEWYHITFDEFATRFSYGKWTRIALEFIFITRLERMKLSSCMPRDKKAM
jgi:hypothetical protein